MLWRGLPRMKAETIAGTVTWTGRRWEFALDGKRAKLSGFARPVPTVPSVGTRVEIDLRNGYVIAIREVLRGP